MHTFDAIVETLNRPAVYVRGLQTRFDLPVYDGRKYSEAYLAFLRNIVFLRVMNVPEESLRNLWRLEKKLLQLLHADSTGSPTWFLDACGPVTHPRRRLLLSNYDLGVELPSGSLQLGLNFDAGLPELFSGRSMGEDALRLLGEYLKQFNRIQNEVNDEIPLVRSATQWAAARMKE